MSVLRFKVMSHCFGGRFALKEQERLKIRFFEGLIVVYLYNLNDGNKIRD